MKKVFQTGFIFFCAVVFSQIASAQYNIYMKLVSNTLGQIQGESTDKNYTGDVNVYSVGQNITGCATFSGGTGTPCAANLGDFTIQKNLDKTSPVLAQIMNTGGSLATIDLYYTKNSASTELQFYSIHLTNAFITKISEVASTSDAIQQQVSFAATTATWRYQPQNADGSLGTAVTYTWTRP
jgi:type VI secretion system Hcp family effector